MATNNALRIAYRIPYIELATAHTAALKATEEATAAWSSGPAFGPEAEALATAADYCAAIADEIGRRLLAAQLFEAALA